MLHSTLPAMRPSQRSSGHLLGEALKPTEVMTRSVREGKWPHLTLTLAVLCMELHTGPAALSAQASRHALPCSVSLCHSYPSAHGAESLRALIWCGSARPSGPERCPEGTKGAS